MPPPLQISAPAKINLHLHITDRMDNGYHALDSLVVFTDCCDDLYITPSDEFKLSLTDEHGHALSLDCEIKDNLVSRAVFLLANRLNISPDIHIRLLKRIPVAAGLGGGSTDAAATLRALKNLWSPRVSIKDIETCAMELGSDIIACLNQTPSIMRETGNKIVPAPRLPELYGVLVNPNIPCPTAQVYKTYANGINSFHQDVLFPEKFLTVRELCDFLNQYTSNDLTAAAIQTAPVIQTVLQQLGKLPDCLLARLSGSGATFFAIFENEIASRQGANLIKNLYPEWWVRQVILNKSID